LGSDGRYLEGADAVLGPSAEVTAVLQPDDPGFLACDFRVREVARQLR
jgi:hypothetical protein